MTVVVYAIVVMVLAFAGAAGAWGYSFALDDLPHADILWVVGFSYLAIFIVLNFWVERAWFPRPRAGAVPPQPLVGANRRAHIAFGTVEATFFVLSILLIGSGTSIMGTRGYGSF